VHGYRREDPDIKVWMLIEIDHPFATKAFSIADQICGPRYYWARLDTKPIINAKDKLRVVYRRRRR
jgi:hypothetical protein